MKKKLLITILCFAAFSITNIQAQNVPNGGFENWTSGDPDSWFTTNISGFATPITQETPPYAGTFAARGTVVTSLAGPVPPIIASTDMTGAGFPITQAYANLSFAYKMNVTGTARFFVAVTMNDILDSTVGVGGAFYSGSVNTFTAVTLPITYIGPNPVTCIILIEIVDTTSAPLTLGNYFVVDEVGLSGLASVQEPASTVNIANVYPNPANLSASVQYNLPSKSDVQFELLNVQGKTVHEVFLPGTNAGRHEMKFDAANIPAGLYILRMKTNQGIAFSRLQIVR